MKQKSREILEIAVAAFLVFGLMAGVFGGAKYLRATVGCGEFTKRDYESDQIPLRCVREICGEDIEISQERHESLKRDLGE